MLKKYLNWLAIVFIVAGYSALLISDFQGILTKNACYRLREKMIRDNWSDDQSHKIVSYCRRRLKASAWDIQKLYHQTLHEKEREKIENEKQKARLLNIKNYFGRCKFNVERLMVVLK